MAAEVRGLGDLFPDSLIMSEQKRQQDDRDRSSQPGPSTNSEAVPDGLEGSINEDEGVGRKQQGRTADRAEGDERRSDEN
jgi:hypothetical protein